MRFRLLVLFSFLFSFHLKAAETSEVGVTVKGLVKFKNDLQEALLEESVDEERVLNLAQKLFSGRSELLSDPARVGGDSSCFTAVKKTFIDVYICFVGLNSQKESVRLLLQGIATMKDLPHNHKPHDFLEANKAFQEREKAILERQERLAPHHGAALDRVQFVDSLERIFAELVAFSHQKEAQGNILARKLGNYHKRMRRNMVWMFRDIFGPIWKEAEESQVDYRRLALILRIYKEKGAQAAYELCDLTHQMHRENGTQRRNTSSVNVARFDDVTTESLGHHLSLLEPEEKEEAESSVEESGSQGGKEPSEEATETPEAASSSAAESATAAQIEDGEGSKASMERAKESKEGEEERQEGKSEEE